MIRWYVMPIETINGTYRGPKYLLWRFGTDNNHVNVRWGMMDFGREPLCLVWADVSTTEHTTLANQIDVHAIPENIDDNPTSIGVTSTISFLESMNIPAGWVDSSLTWREIMRTICSIFLLFQRVTTLTKSTVFKSGVTLNTQYQNLPIAVQGAMIQYADEHGLVTNGLQQTTTLRQILKYLADGWKSRQIIINDVSL